MTKNKTQTDLLDGWSELIAAVHAHRNDLHGVDGLLAVVEQRLEEARHLMAHREQARLESLATTRQLHTLLTEGNDEARRLRELVRGTFGHRDERLTAFGIAPIRPRRRNR